MDVNCYKCHKALDLREEQAIPRSEECDHCSASIRCCHMCRFYDPQSYNECREPVAERIIDKEKANFCDNFTLMNKKNAPEKKENLLSAAEALFKK